MKSRIGWFAGGVAASAWLRRVSTRTGVRDEEAFAALPGDDMIAQPMVQWTRGVTVAASAEAVWPWLVQAGHGRRLVHAPMGRQHHGADPISYPDR